MNSHSSALLVEKDVQIRNLDIWEFNNDGKVDILLLQSTSLPHVLV